MDARKGSITVYLSLILLLLLSLLFAALYSARVAAGRAVLAGCAEQGMYSLFAQYDTELYETYGLLFFDDGYGGSTLQLSAMPEIAMDYAAAAAGGGSSLLSGKKDLLGIRLADASLDSYTLATDGEGAAFRRQVCQVMKRSLGTAGLQALTNRLTASWVTSMQQESAGGDCSEETAEEDYDSLLAAAAEQAAEQAAASAETGDPGVGEAVSGEEETAGQGAEEAESAQAGEGFVNPIESIRQVRKLGILANVIADPASVSSCTVDTASLPSGRALQQGMGVVTKKGSSTDKLLQLAYLAEKFPCYTSEEKGKGLQYQLEYAIAGGSSDRENLKTTVKKLLRLREAANLLYLMTDAGASAEAEACGLTIATLMAMPHAAQGIASIVKVLWAYGESLLDLRELLSGGKIALIKDSSSWQLPLSSLHKVQACADELRHSSSNGLDYSWYLQILLMKKSSQELTDRLMDLTEYNMRINGSHPEFSLDCCVDAAEVTLQASLSGQACSVTRRYSYDMEQSG